MGLLAGLISPAHFSADTARICVTFLGLFAAGILPTISLLLQGVNSSGKSVYKIDDLQREISEAIDDLFRILGSAGIATFILMTLTIETPVMLNFLQTESALQRIGNASVAALVVYIVSRAGRIPSIIRRALSIRFEQARFEAKQTTRDAAPGRLEIKSAFPKKEGFGASRSLKEVKSTKPDGD
ncbi:MAG: hypothetical protein JY451_11680 [Erythrobacter sp.]|nr:MAG: hypothetical protein JY451_11680 [Erythrobacter sp.]